MARIPWFALAITIATANGCRPYSIDESAGVDTSTRSSPSSPLTLKSTNPTRDLGLIRLGEEGVAIFDMSNATNASLELRLSRPSCGCLAARLDREHVDPGQSVQLELVLSNSGRPSAGKREGSVAIKILGSAQHVTVFTVKGIVEGMSTVPYSLPLPPDLTGFTPDSIYGEIILGKQRDNAHVEIVDADVLTQQEELIRLGTPALSPLENMGDYNRYRLSIPVYLASGTSTVARSYPVRITYRIDDLVADYTASMNVFPKAVVPQGG